MDNNNNYNNNNYSSNDCQTSYDSNYANYNNPYGQQQTVQPYMNEEEHKSMLSRTMTGVYGLMFVGLLITAVVSVLSLYSWTLMSFLYSTPYGFYVFMFAELGIVMFISARINKIQASTATILFFVYAVVNGITLSVIFFVYSLGTIALAFISAAGMFGIMSIYGAVTKKNLTSVGNMALMGLIGVLIASLVNMLFGSTLLDTIICYIGVAVFLALTAYDTQKIKAMVSASADQQTTKKIVVIGALNLYLDMINIFLYILRILGRKK